MILRTTLMMLLFGGSTLAVEDNDERVPFSFDKPAAARLWQTIKDGVMVGRSDGRFKINDDKKIQFVNGALMPYGNVECDGTYRHHLQGICTNDHDFVYWSFTTTLVKTDTAGNVTKKIEVANHHGDLCYHDGKIYVAVNLGRFNDPAGNADSWVYVYDADDLSLASKHETQEVFHGAGGIGYRDGRFFVVGGLPDGVQENYVYEYDGNFKFVKRHNITSGHTHLGIQTAAFAHGKWFFGCYGDPKILLVTDEAFNMLGRYEFDCSLGIVGVMNGQLLSAGGKCEKVKGCSGRAQLAVSDDKAGLIVKSETTGSSNEQ